MLTRLASVEWGTFRPGNLDSGHVDLAALRTSGAFARVVEIVPGRLAFLQLTDDPIDDLQPEIETKLAVARQVLGPLLVDTSDIELRSH